MTYNYELAANCSKIAAMILEYLDDIDGGGKFPDADPKRLIRIYDFTVMEIRDLQKAVRKLIQFDIGTLNLSQLLFVTSKNCSLTFVVSDSDDGIESTTDQNIFICKLTSDVYVNMLDILEHIVKNDFEVSGYNWLYNPSDDSKIDLLVSADGYW